MEENIEEILNEYYPDLDSKIKDKITYFCEFGKIKIHDPKVFFNYMKEDYQKSVLHALLELGKMTKTISNNLVIEKYISKGLEERKKIKNLFHDKGTIVIKSLTDLLQMISIFEKISSFEDILAFSVKNENNVNIIEINNLANKTKTEIEKLVYFYTGNNNSSKPYEGFV